MLPLLKTLNGRRRCVPLKYSPVIAPIFRYGLAQNEE